MAHCCLESFSYKCAKLLLTVFVLCNAVHAVEQRNITISNPCPKLNLVYVTAVGSDDILHYYVSSVGFPSILMARTLKSANATAVDCNSFSSEVPIQFKGSITMMNPSYVYSLLFTRLFDYQDIQDQVVLPDCSSNTSCVEHKLNKLVWNPVVIEDNTITFSSNTDLRNLHFLENGSISINVEISGEDSRMDLSPHLKLTPNLTVVTITLDSLNATFRESRYGIELVSVTIDDANLQSSTPSSVNEARSVDDEYSPGIFVENNWIIGNKSAYVQWKPVAYLSADHKLGVSSATKVWRKPDKPVDSFVGRAAIPNERSLALAYFGDTFEDRYLVALNISMGKKGDKFYPASNYTAWVFSAGIGEPYIESISLGMILIIAIGLGIPLVLLVLGFCWMACRRRSQPAYENITSSSYGSIQT